MRQFVKAVTEAESGDTIELGKGNYTLYKVPSTGHTKGKDLTFVGLGADKTAWNIGALVPDPANYGTEYNGDYSFDGAGTVTFQNMTLRSERKIISALSVQIILLSKTARSTVRPSTGATHPLPLQTRRLTVRPVIMHSGRTALPTMTFENCTFNSSGKVINVYTDYGAGKQDITVNFENCTVKNTSDPAILRQSQC